MATPPNPTGRISIHVLHKWDSALLRTEKLTPTTSASVLLDFRVDPEPEEAGLPSDLAAALAQALLEHGTVAGRWFDRQPAPSGATLYEIKRKNPLHWLIDHLRNTQPEPVITTRSLPTVCELLDTGWSVQQQALLVLEPMASQQFDPVLQTLGTEWNWTAFTFPSPVLALIAPGNDGDYILIAALTEARLAPILESTLQAFRASGFTVHS